MKLFIFYKKTKKENPLFLLDLQNFPKSHPLDLISIYWMVFTIITLCLTLKLPFKGYLCIS